MINNCQKNWFCFVLVFGLIMACILLPGVARAGFGISPGHIWNDRLHPGASFETEIILSRGHPVENLKAEAILDVPPEIQDWFSFYPGPVVLLPEGEKRVPLRIRIDVPEDAEFKHHRGHITIQTRPAEVVPGVGVGVLLGARMSVDLTVTELRIIDFIIRNLRVPDSEQGFNWGFIRLPGRVDFLMNVENIGNVKVAPHRVEIEVWDLAKHNLIAQGVDKSLRKVEPFDKQDVEANFWLNIDSGVYWAVIRVFKNEYEILRDEKLPLTITPFEMNLKDWLIVVGIIIIIIGIVLIILWKTGVLGKLILKIKKKCEA